MPRQITPATSLENLKREAKRWLRALRAGDGAARTRLDRAVAGAPAAPTLRDVQHALAREFGLPGWTDLRDRLSGTMPVEGAPGEPVPREILLRFLDNACPDHHVRGRTDHVRAQATAMRLLARFPDIARASFQTAVVCGDLDRVRGMLADEPALAIESDATPSEERSWGGGDHDLLRHDFGPKGWAPLLYLCFTRLPLPKVTNHAVAIAELLLEHDADPTEYFMAGDSRYTPLVGVIGEGEEDRPPHQQRNALARLLLEHGADPYDNQVMYNLGFHLQELWFLDLSYETSVRRGRKRDWDDPAWPMLDMGGYGNGARWHLEHAIRKGDASLVRWCLAHGADPNAPPARDRRLSQASLYQAAMQQGELEIAGVLLRGGARVTAVPETPLMSFIRACLRLDRDGADRWLAADAELLGAHEPLLTAVRKGRTDVVALLLDLGVSPEVENAQKERALHLAAYKGAVDIVKLLLSRGAEVDPVESNWGNTPLAAAAYYQHRAVMDLLAPRSRDIWELVHGGYVDRVRELLAEEPGRARISWEGSTPLHWLPPDDEGRAMSIAPLFLENGADASMVNRDGMTAADVAERNGMYELAALLRGGGT